MTQFVIAKPWRTDNVGAAAHHELRLAPAHAGRIVGSSRADTKVLRSLELLDPTATVVRRVAGDQPELTVVVPEGLPAAQPWTVRVTNLTGKAATLRIGAEYGTATPIQERLVPRALLDDKLAMLVDELRPRIVIDTPTTRVELDPSVMEQLGVEALTFATPRLDKIIHEQLHDIRSKRLVLGLGAIDAQFPRGCLEGHIDFEEDGAEVQGTFAANLRRLRVGLRLGLCARDGALSYDRVEVSFPVKIDFHSWVADVAARLVDLSGRVQRGVEDLAERFLRGDKVRGAFERAAARGLGILTPGTAVDDVFIDSQGIHLRYHDTGLAADALEADPVAPRVRHLVVVMMENRSFDHLLGFLTRVDDRDVDGPSGDEREGDLVIAQRSDPTFPNDPPHGSASVDRQLGGHFTGEFKARIKRPGNQPGDVLTWMDPTTIPVTAFLARQFCVCDRWFSSLPGQTWPNRLYATAGQSGGVRDNPAKVLGLYHFPTVFDVLESAGVSWRYYEHDVGFIRLYDRWVLDTKRVRPVSELYAAIAATNPDDLPRVSFVEPNIADFGVSNASDDHPPADLRGGQHFLRKLYESLRARKHADWMLLVTYDEHGGFADHVDPRAFKVEDDHADIPKHPGVRVPAILISPWLAPQVCTRRFDHAAIIRTILDGFCGGPTAPAVAASGVQSLARVKTAAAFHDLVSVLSQPRVLPVAPAAPELPEADDAPPPDLEPGDPRRLLTELNQLRARMAQELALEADAVPPPDPPPVARCEGLYVRVADQHALARLATRLAEWSFANVAGAPEILEASGPLLTNGAAWQLVHELRTVPGIVEVEPLWELALGAQPATSPSADLVADAPNDAATATHPRWSPYMVHAPDAWALGAHGAGVVIGHLDTGDSDHAEVVEATGRTPEAPPRYTHDYVDGDLDPRDELEAGPLRFPGHGTATASVIASPGLDAQGMIGVAPAATIRPFRISRSVVHMSTRTMARAIHRAVDSGAHIISISAGGLPSAALRDAIAAAEARGVIVVAAAGNYVGFVVWPAGYEHVLACAACDLDGRPWPHSSRGRRVDLTAPGVGVWRAQLDAPDGDLRAIAPGSGTSYATATVAGALAVWLSYHGRDALIARYGKSHVPRLARYMIKTTCVVTDALAIGFGAGLLDVGALVRAPLPDPDLMAHQEGASAAPLAQLADVLPGIAPDAVANAVARFLAPADLHTLDELAFHVATRPDVAAWFRAAVTLRDLELDAVVAPTEATTLADLLASDASPQLRAALRRA